MERRFPFVEIIRLPTGSWLDAQWLQEAIALKKRSRFMLVGGFIECSLLASVYDVVSAFRAQAGDEARRCCEVHLPFYLEKGTEPLLPLIWILPHCHSLEDAARHIYGDRRHFELRPARSYRQILQQSGLRYAVFFDRTVRIDSNCDYRRAQIILYFWSDISLSSAERTGPAAVQPRSAMARLRDFVLQGIGKIRPKSKQGKPSRGSGKGDSADTDSTTPGISAFGMGVRLGSIRAKGFNVTLSGESIPYNQLEFVEAFDGLTLEYRDTGDREWSELSDEEWADTEAFMEEGNIHYITITEGAAQEAQSLRVVLGSALDKLFGRLLDCNNENGSALNESLDEDLLKHNGLRIRVAANLPQNTCLYQTDSGVVFIFNQEIISNKF